MFDPMYDSYTSMAKRSGAVIVPVRLRLPDFSVPLEELAAAVTPRTKMIMINTPHNPSGKVGGHVDMCVCVCVCVCVCLCVGGEQCVRVRGGLAKMLGIAGERTGLVGHVATRQSHPRSHTT